MSALPHLFSPVKIGALELRNRLVMSPMENQYATPEGLPSQRQIDYFVARAKGGVGLVTLGASSIDPRHKEIPSSLHFGSDEVIDPHRALVDAVHEHGAKIQPQIAHAGPDGLGPELHGIDAPEAGSRGPVGAGAGSAVSSSPSSTFDGSVPPPPARRPTEPSGAPPPPASSSTSPGRSGSTRPVPPPPSFCCSPIVRAALPVFFSSG